MSYKKYIEELEWHGVCLKCNDSFAANDRSKENPYPNGVLCPSCREIGYQCVGVVHFSPAKCQRPEIFKQDTPEQQGAAILQGIESHLINWKDGVEPSKESLENALMLVEHLKVLHELCLYSTW